MEEAGDWTPTKITIHPCPPALLEKGMRDMHLKIVYTIVDKGNHLKMNIHHDLKPNKDKPVDNRQEVNAIKVIRKNSRAEILENLKFDLKQAENNLSYSFNSKCERCENKFNR